MGSEMCIRDRARSFFAIFMIFASINKNELYRQAIHFRLSACAIIIPHPSFLSISSSHFYHIYKFLSFQSCIFHKFTEASQSRRRRDRAPRGRGAQPLRHCFAMPPPLPRGGFGIAENFSSSPEAPLLGELSAKQTERLYEGEPDREPLLDSTSPSRLTPCHLPYRGEALAVLAK